MRRPRPVFLRWDGEVFVPEPSFKHYLAREYVIGEVYPMLPVEERSRSSHNHYFAALAEGFNNLSEENAKHFANPDHLREWSLIQTGYCSETETVLADNKQARKYAADIKARNPYAVMSIRGNVVIVWEAESQAYAAMKKERFEASKKAVLELVASMARTTASQLNKEARRHGR